ETTSTRVKKRERSRQRGAAMAEAVVSIPFFIVIFACTLFADRVYTTKIKTLNDSKRAAWTSALKGCSGNGGDNLVEAGGGSQSDMGQAGQLPQTQLTKKGFGGAVGTSDGSAVAPGYIGGQSLSISSTTTVMCNQIPEDGNLVGAAKMLWNLLKS